MFGKHFEWNENTIRLVEEIGRHMPGGFLIYQAEEPETLIYANHAVLKIFGCEDLEEFKRLTGYTFKGLVHPDDYAAVSELLKEQLSRGDMDHLEYRILRKDGSVGWVDDYGHFTDTDAYGGIFYVFLSDITDQRERMEEDAAVRNAVLNTLTNVYNTVWLINDVETESCSLYHGDTEAGSIHAEAIRNALSNPRYTDTKTQYVNTMVAPEDRERMQEQISLPYILDQLAVREQFSVTFIRALKDGPRYYRIDFAKVAMPGGKTGVMMGFKDVDNEVRMNQKLKAAQQHVKKTEEENRRLVAEVQSAAKLADLMASVASLLSNMPAMSFSKDAKTGKYLACNQPFAEYAHKATPDDVVGLTDFDIFDPVTAAHFVEVDKKTLSMDEPYVFFENVPDAAGTTIRNLQTTKLKFEDASGRLCTLGMCVDVTEIARMKSSEAKQQEMEERLALQEELLEEQRQRQRQDSMIVALSSDYRSVYYVDLDENEAVCYQKDKYFSEAPSTGERFPYLEDFTEFCMNHVAESYQEGFLQFIQPDNIRRELLKQPVIAYRYLELRDGQEMYAMLRMAGVRHLEDRPDHLVHAIGVGFTDIDEEMRHALVQQQTLVEALAAAEEANKAKTAFLSNMSHEIRTPMNAIIGLNNIALNEPGASDQIKEYLGRIGASAQHLLGIINDILDMSRIESGRMTIRQEEFSFSKGLEQVNTIINGQCREKGLTYDCQIKGQIDDYYVGDIMKLKQVLINILGNAVKFTPAGGAVRFDIEEGPRLDRKATLKFVIRDTGIGMSKEYLPHIFDAFSQEDISTTSRYGSTGLGMPITKSIVELMNGHIEVESEKNKGSVFTVTVTLGESDRKNAREDEESLDPHEMSVLVIDDDQVALEHAVIVLGQIGISCETAESGWEGVEKVRIRHGRREEYDLILVDWRMPEMDGIETARQIRAIVGNDTPIIILTSFNWDDIADEAKSAGVDTFVAKPLFAGNVMDEFREAFRRKNELLEKKTADLKGKRVLLAEDVDVNAEIMMMVLSMREMQVELAGNGRIAVERFAGSEPGYYDAILMDMRMPEMDGLEATRRIRAMDRTDAKTIPIIALTANAFDEDVQRSMQAGLNAHLSKPVEAEALFQTLESLIKP